MKFFSCLVENGKFGFGDYVSSRYFVVWKFFVLLIVSFLFFCEKWFVGRSKRIVFFKNLEGKISVDWLKRF